VILSRAPGDIPVSTQRRKRTIRYKGRATAHPRYAPQSMAALASKPTSSLPVTGHGSTITGDTDCRAGRVRAQAASSLMTAGNEPVNTTSAGARTTGMSHTPTPGHTLIKNS